MEMDELKRLFYKYNQKYFNGELHRVRLGWSDKMTLCAGKTYFRTRGSWKACDIRLSKPLLSQRPPKDAVNTLLHEMIHAYLNLTMGTTLRESHGPEFRKHMNRINTAEKTKITIYHNFHKEVDKFRIHVYRCDGPCQNRKPYFGILKRAIERPPGPEDHWWSRHSAECWGTFRKISGPGADKEAVKSWKTPTKRAEEPARYALAVKQLNTGSEPCSKFSDCQTNQKDVNMESKFLSAAQGKEKEDALVERIKVKYANQRTTVLLPQKSKGKYISSSSKSVYGQELRESYKSSNSWTVDGQRLVDGKLNPNYQCRTPTKIKVAKYLAKYQLVVEGKENSHIHTSPDMKLVNGSVIWNYEQRTPSKIRAEKYIERFKNVIRRDLGDSADPDKAYTITPSGHVIYNESIEADESCFAQEEPELPEPEITSSGKKKKKAVKQSNLITRYLKQSEPSPSSQSVSSTDGNDDFVLTLPASSEIRKARRKLYEDGSLDKSPYKIPKLAEYSKYSEINTEQRRAACTDTGHQNQISSGSSTPAEDSPTKYSKSMYPDVSGQRKGNSELTNKAEVSDFKDEQQDPHVDSRMDIEPEPGSAYHMREETTTDCSNKVFKFKKHASECTDDEERVHESSQNISSDIKKDPHQSSSVPLLKKSNSVDTSKTDCALCGKTVSIYTYEDHLAQCMWDDDLTQDIFSDTNVAPNTDSRDSEKKGIANESFKTEGSDRGTEKRGTLEKIWDDRESSSSHDEFRNDKFSANKSSNLLSSDGSSTQVFLDDQSKQLSAKKSNKNEQDVSALIGCKDSIKKSKDDVNNGNSENEFHNSHKGDKADITSSKAYVGGKGCTNSLANSKRIHDSQQPGCSKWYNSEKLKSENKEQLDPDKSLPCPVCGNEIIAAELDVHLKYCDMDDDFSEELTDIFDKDSDDFFSEKGHTSENVTYVHNDGSSSPIVCPVCKERMDPGYLEEHLKLCISFMSEEF